MSNLDEVYERFRDTGPEWGEDSLTNHGPMAAEVLVRRGRSGRVDAWVDDYLRRLDPLPAPTGRIDPAGWRDALGDGRRIGDWTAFFDRQVAERPWREVLVEWWPRLLPGIAAGATHGVIRVGHAGTALATAESPAATAELARGLAFWAARMRPVPAVAPAGTLSAAEAVPAVPRVPAQRGPVAERFGQLPGTPGWSASVAALRAPAGPEEARATLTDLVTAATLRYRTHGHASPVLLVHTATAPNAVLRTLPLLPRELWAPSLTSVWVAVAAILAGYAPGAPAGPELLPAAPTGADPAAEVLDRAVRHGDEHVIKFADTAVDVHARTGEPAALAAALRVAQLIAPR